MMAKKEKCSMRGLSAKFLKNLKVGGFLQPLIQRVKADATLCLEIRENYINIYYRGGNILRIKENNGYVAWFDEKYCSNNIFSAIKTLPKKLKVESDVQSWIIAFPLLKQTMDFWFRKNPKDERECQQAILRENNSCGVGNSTDYFIIDIEYDNHKGARFDLVAVKWESDGVIRKLTKGYKPKLCFIELKYGDNALTGRAGMLKHIEDFSEYLSVDPSFASIKVEMLTILHQKRELGLIPALRNNKNVIKAFSDESEYMFILANHDPASSKLNNILKDIQKKYETKLLGFGFKFCSSNFMGYGLYKQNVYSFDEFRERFRHQIPCNS